MAGGHIAIEGSTARNSFSREAPAPRRQLRIVEGNATRRTDPSVQVLPTVAHAALHAKGTGSARSRILSCAAIALALALVFGSATVLDRQKNSTVAAVDSVEMTEILVQPGDSLWRLAQEHGIEGVPTARTVELILAWNDLESSTIQAGTMLIVPASD